MFRFVSRFVAMGFVFFISGNAFAGSYSCSKCTNYNWIDAQTGRSAGYAHSKYKIYYNGKNHSESSEFETPGKCLFSMENDDRCGVPATSRHKFSCSASCYRKTIGWSFQGQPYTRPAYAVNYGGEKYSEKSFEEEGACEADRDENVFCR